MRRRRSNSAKVGVAVVAVVLLASLAQFGMANPATADQPLAELVDLEALLDRTLTASEATQLEDAQEVVSDLPTDSIANAWIVDGAGLAVGVTAEAQPSEVSAELAAVGVMDADLRRVEHSQAELDSIVLGVYSLPGMENISSAMHDYAANRVVLTSHVPVTDELRAAVYNLFGDAAAIAMEPQTNEPATYRREKDTSPFYAGAWIGRYGASSAHCTVGYSWVAASGAARMLTAGHCYPSGSNFSVATNYTSPYHFWMGKVIGTTVGSSGTFCCNGDLALIDTTETAEGDLLNRSGAPRMWTGEATSSTSTTIESVDKWTANGTAVCYSGMKTGVQCGTTVQDNGDGGFNVVDENYSYESADGRVWTYVALATKGWGQCPIPGDSGAPVYINTPGTGVAAHGILQGTGGGGDDHFVGKFEPANCRMIFTEIGQAYDQWNGNIEIN